MSRPKFKRMKTYRRKVQVPSKRKHRPKEGATQIPRGHHLDGSVCSLYCSCMQKEGFGHTSLIYKKEESLFGDYEEFLTTIHFLLNSKVFMEFLCTCRHYLYALNLSKKCYYTMVLSSTLRDIAMASIHHQSSYDITRFIQYCLKWVRDLKRDSITRDSFLTYYMREVHSELNTLNSILFKQWCGMNLLQDNSFQPLTNPLQIILQKQKENCLTTRGVYSLLLPTQINTKAIQLGQTNLLHMSETPPMLTITSSLLHQTHSIVQWSDVLLLICSSPTDQVKIPPFITLPGKVGSSVQVYTVRSLAGWENGEWVVFKRLFPTMYHFSLKRKIYDVHRSGKWIRMRGGNVSELSWETVQKASILWIHYERISH